MGRREDGLCPCCGKRPRHVMDNGRVLAYCRACYNRYQKVQNRARRERAVSSDNIGGAAPLSIPPEVYAAIRRRGFDPERVVGLAFAILLIRTGRDRRPGGQIRRYLAYRGKKLYY